MPWVGLQCVVVVFPDHTHLLFLYDTSLVEREPIVLIAFDDLRDSLTPPLIFSLIYLNTLPKLCAKKNQRGFVCSVGTKSHPLPLLLPISEKYVYNGHSQKDGKLVFKTNYCLMQVKSIAECSKGKGAFCSTFDHH